MVFRKLLILSLLLLPFLALAQTQDMNFHITAQLLAGKKILKVKRDYYDPYLWVLAQNNGVYRINSQTLTVDDFTSAFSAYNALQFVDIAGRSQDTVFVATNSPNVIEYNKGALTAIGPAMGLKDTVTSIGMADANGVYSTNYLLVATLHGLGTYDVIASQIFNYNTSSFTTNPVQVFSSTYRSELITGNYNDNSSYYPAEFFNEASGYDHDIVYYAQSGSTINTAFYTTTGLEAPSEYGGSFYWGNKNGVWQEWLDEQLVPPSAVYHYLDNVNVNKIADIIGLPSFYTAPAPNSYKDNLLVGTDQGFYFSSSVIANPATGLNDFSFTYFTALGNIPVYDVCVNGTATEEDNVISGCENGVWLGTANGIYLLAPDYASYITNSNYANILQLGSGFLTDSLTQVNVCQGDTTTPFLSTGYATPGIQWKKNGQDIVGATQSSLKIAAPGEYYAILYDSCDNVHMQTNHIKVNSVSGPVFTFNYPPVISMCAGSSDTLQVTYNPAYHYRWYTNGALNGDTTATFITSQSGAYYVEVSACTNSWEPSSKVQVDVIRLPTPQITSENNPNCAGDTATLSTGFPADSPYTYKWYLNGGLVTTGNGLPALKTLTAGNYTVTITSTIDTACSQTSAVYQLSFIPAPAFGSQFPAQYTTCGSVTLEVQPESGEKIVYRWYTNNELNGDTTNTFEATQSGGYRVEISSCQGAWVSSNTIQLTIINLPTPAITANQQSYCAGQDAVLTESVPVDPSYSITWYNNGAALPANNNKTSITTNVGGNYTVIVSSVEDSGEGTPCTETSSVLALTFNPLPTLSIAEQNNASLCIGQKVTLTAQYSGGSLAWTTGETSNSITVTQSGIYGATVTSASGCSKDTSITLTFSPAPVLNLSDTVMCAYTQGPITLTAPAGFASYKWNGVSGSQTYTVTQPGIITLTVTDANGCEATQQIKVADDCTAVYIPNTITPNGDGVNDTWVIDGLDETATVKVFTRWGMQVFNSVGHGSPWNGEYGGKKLPQGVYYYVITAKNNSQTLSGWLTIIY